MKTRIGSPHHSAQISASADGAPKTTSRFAPSWRLLTLAAEVTVLLLVAIAIGLLLSSCSGERSASSEGTSAQVALAESPTSGGVVAGTVVAQSGVPSAPKSESLTPVGADSLPPDVAVTVSETSVEPGQTVEIEAQGSTDVTGMALWDGLHDKQAFVYDSGRKLWLAQYRVPLQTSERVALSVTARNESHRWRRVWVFLNTVPEIHDCEADSTSK